MTTNKTNKKTPTAKRRFDGVCSLLDSCGGCTTQEIAYAAQLEAKRTAIRAALAGLVAEDEVPAVAGMTYPFGYRTRLMMPALPVHNGPGGSIVRFGFYGQGGQQLVEAGGCPVQHPLTLATLAGVNQALIGMPVRATTPRPRSAKTRPGGKAKRGEGWLHGLAIRVDPPTGSSEVTLIGRTPKVPGGSSLTERLARLPGVRGVHLNINPSRSSYLMGEGYVHLAGSKRTIFTIAGLELHLSPGSFLQTNAEATEILVGQVLELLPERMDYFADLYGGVGVFARASEARWRKALVAESNPASIADLRAWNKSAGRNRVRVYDGRVDERIDDLLAQGPDTVLLDPPRSGCGPRVTDALVAAAIPTVVYVACSLESLERDAGALVAGGYRVTAVRAVDMFPHTEHIETVVRLTWDGPPPADDEAP